MKSHYDPYRRLRVMPLFRGFDDRSLAQVDRILCEIEVPAGRQLIRQGTSGRELGMVCSGTAEVRRDGECVALVGPGDVYGASAVFAGQCHAETVWSITSMVVLVTSAHEASQLLTIPGVGERLGLVGHGILDADPLPSRADATAWNRDLGLLPGALGDLAPEPRRSTAKSRRNWAQVRPL